MMYYVDFCLYQCLIPFILAFSAMVIAYAGARPPLKMWSLKYAIPVTVAGILFILLVSAVDVIHSEKYWLLVSKIFGIAGIGLAYTMRPRLTLQRDKQDSRQALTTGTCGACQAHQRTIWGPLPFYPKSLCSIDKRNHISLLECQKCGGHWVHYAYPPDKRFPYLVKWSFGLKTWLALRKVDRGIPILNWAAVEIKRSFAKLSGEEALQVELHRKCTHFQNNPIDLNVPPPSFTIVPE